MRIASLIMCIALLAGCQRESDVPYAAATPPDQTPTGPASDTISPPITPDPSTAPPVVGTPETAKRVSLQEAMMALQSGDAVLVDVRGADSFNAQHASGAINIPEDQILNRIADLPIGKQVITYCT